MAQTTYATMFVSALLTFLDQMAERKKKEEEHLWLLDLSASPQVKIVVSLVFFVEIPSGLRAVWAAFSSWFLAPRQRTAAGVEEAKGKHFSASEGVCG